MKEDKWTKIWKIIEPPVVYFFIQMAVELAAALADFLNGSAVAVMAVSAAIVIIFFGKEYMKEKNKQNLQVRKVQGSYVFTMVAFGVFLGLFTGNILSFFNIDNLYGSYEATASELLSGNIVFRLAVLGALTPFAEEIIYRGLVYGRAKKEFGTGYAILLSSALFGVFHFNLLQGLYALIIGAAFSLCYEISGTLKVPVYMHMTINTLTIFADYYRVDEIMSGNLFFKLTIILMEFVIMLHLLEIIIKKLWKRGN